jgi:hypothetical protein
LISDESDQRKDYTDRPELDDDYDPEKAERGTPAQRAAEKAKPKDAETERLLARAKLRKVDEAKEKLVKKDARKKKRAVRKDRRKINRPAPQNQHAMAKFLKKKPAPKPVDPDMTLESPDSSSSDAPPPPKPAPKKRVVRKPAPKKKKVARKPAPKKKKVARKPDKKQKSLTNFFKNLT